MNRIMCERGRIEASRRGAINTASALTKSIIRGNEMAKTSLPKNQSPNKSYLEKARSSGLMTKENEAAFLAVSEMLKRPLSLQQMREQVRMQALDRWQMQG